MLYYLHKSGKSTNQTKVKDFSTGEDNMNKKVKMIITLCCYAGVICTGILLIPRFFNRASKQEVVTEVVYGSIDLSEPLYPSAPGDDVSDNKYACLYGVQPAF